MKKSKGGQEDRAAAGTIGERRLKETRRQSSNRNNMRKMCKWNQGKAAGNTKRKKISGEQGRAAGNTKRKNSKGNEKTEQQQG